MSNRDSTAREAREARLARMLKLIREKPGIRPSELNRLMGLEHSAGLRNALIKRGLVWKQRDGAAVRYYSA